jgi:hypothetical protein
MIDTEVLVYWSREVEREMPVYSSGDCGRSELAGKRISQQWASKSEIELSKKTCKRRRWWKSWVGFLRKCDKESDDCGLRDARDMDRKGMGCVKWKRRGEGGWALSKTPQPGAIPETVSCMVRAQNDHRTKTAESRCELPTSHELLRQPDLPMTSPTPVSCLHSPLLAVSRLIAVLLFRPGNRVIGRSAAVVWPAWMHFVNACTTASWSSSQPAALVPCTPQLHWDKGRDSTARLAAWPSEFPFDASTPLLQSRPSFSPPRLVPGEACRPDLFCELLLVSSPVCCLETVVTTPCFSPSDTDNTTSIGVVEAVLAVPSCLSPATARAMRSFELLRPAHFDC